MSYSHRRAREIARALVQDLANVSAYPLPQNAAQEPGACPTEALVDRWEGIINSILEPALIGGGRFKTKHGWEGWTDDPAIIELFLDKYPEIRRAIPIVQAKARECFPDMELCYSLQLSTDPEGCAVCHEIQNLSLSIIPPTNDVKWILDRMDQLDDRLVDDAQDWIRLLPLLITA